MVSASPEKSGAPNRSTPAWMSEPGAPSRPDFSFYSKRLNELFAQKSKLIAERRALQDSIKLSDEEVELKEKCAALRVEMNEIDIQRKAELALRSSKNDEISELRKRRRQNSEKQRAVQVELGGFASIKEIDAAIAYMRRKTEMIGGGLESEKKMNRRLRQLEEAKSMLAQCQGFSDSVKEDQEYEMMLEQESREIHERIDALNKEYQEKIHAKQELESKRTGLSAQRTDVCKKTDALREQIKEILDEIQKLINEREGKKKVWDAWCVTAKANYYARLDAERKKKNEEAKERRKAERLARKRARALKRQNPFADEIMACSTILQYLAEKDKLLAQQEEELAKSLASRNFDPVAAAPEGFVVITEPVRPSVGKGKLGSSKKTTIQHSDDIINLFNAIEVRPPGMRKFIASSLTEVEAKKKEYETHIKTGELELSSDKTGSEDDDVENDNEIPEHQEQGDNEHSQNSAELHQTEELNKDIDIGDSISEDSTPK